MSNISWAYATAGEPNPFLFKRFANHIIVLKDLNGFKPQANIVWAYATAGEPNPRLFTRSADYVIALKDLKGVNTQNLSIIIWANATAGQS